MPAPRNRTWWVSRSRRCTGGRADIQLCAELRSARPVLPPDLPSTAKRVERKRKVIRVDLHSEKESFREALAFRAPDGSAATLLVLRRGAGVWMTFSGAEKTTVAISDAEVDDLIRSLRAAQHRPQ